MRNFFNKLSPKSFQYICIFICFLGDLSFAGYIYFISSDKQAYLQNFELLKIPLTQAFKSQGLELPIGFEHEIFQVMLQTLVTMLGLYLLAHLIIYFFYYLNKRFAFLYIRFISIMGIIAGITFFSGSMNGHFIWPLIFAVITIAYLFNSFGTHYFPITKVKNQE